MGSEIPQLKPSAKQNEAQNPLLPKSPNAEGALSAIHADLVKTPPATRLASLQETAYVALVDAFQPPMQANAVNTFETIPNDKMRAKDITVPGNPQAQKAYYPANPPEPEHTIDKNDIQPIDSKPGQEKYAWQRAGRLEDNKDIEAEVTYYWKAGGKPGELALEQIETSYTNKAANAAQSGVDIPFINGTGASGVMASMNTKRDIRVPTHDPARNGYDCVIESFPVKAADASGDYQVYITKSFESANGPVEKRTVENIEGTNYEYFYRTRVKRYAGLDADGKTPVGLKSNTFYADPDGGTSKKLMETTFAGGQPTSTLIYDPNTATETVLKTKTYKQYNGQPVIAKIVENNYHGTAGAQCITDNNDDGQLFKERTIVRPDGSIALRLTNDTGDGKQLTLNLYRTINVGGPVKHYGDATFVYKMNAAQKYDFSSMSIHESNGDPVNINIPAGQKITPVFKGGFLVGITGAEFYRKNGTVISPAEVAKILADHPDIAKTWQNEIFHGRTR